MTGEDERGPDKEAGHRLRRWRHQEGGPVRPQQRRFLEPGDVGPHGGGGERVRVQARRDVPAPQPEHLDRKQ